MTLRLLSPRGVEPETPALQVIVDCTAPPKPAGTVWSVPWCQRFFFSLGATELNGEAAMANREADQHYLL